MKYLRQEVSLFPTAQGSAGIVSCALWLMLSADGPEHHRWISPAERDYIMKNRPTSTKRSPKHVRGFKYNRFCPIQKTTESVMNSLREVFLQRSQQGYLQVPWKSMLLSPVVLLLCIESFGRTLNFYMILTELPTYLSSIFGINIIKVQKTGIGINSCFSSL